MNKDNLSQQDFVKLLETKDYDGIFRHCQDFIKSKVERYLKKFHQYEQYTEDFYHEVCIHLLTKSLPSPAFLKACKKGNNYKFYLAKSVQNHLNTLLTRERQKKQSVLALDSMMNTNTDEEIAQDKSKFFIDKSYKEQVNAKDLLGQLKDGFEAFLVNFLATFPKIAYKLLLLLKLQARVRIYEEDLENCFKGIKPKDVEEFLKSLGNSEEYAHKEDKEIYQIIHPYFQKYRKEKGSPAALQRWLNQHISGDKRSQGIMDKLMIVDGEETFGIKDKKLFADFLNDYFRTSRINTPGNYTLKEEKLSILDDLQAQWTTAWVR